MSPTAVEQPGWRVLVALASDTRRRKRLGQSRTPTRAAPIAIPALSSRFAVHVTYVQHPERLRTAFTPHSSSPLTALARDTDVIG